MQSEAVLIFMKLIRVSAGDGFYCIFMLAEHDDAIEPNINSREPKG